MLLVAGTIKVARPRAAAGSLRRSSARLMSWSQLRLDRAARAVGVAEFGAGATALFVSGRVSLVVSGIVFGLFVSFVWLTDSARRRGQSCGCWGSLSDGPAGTKEVRNRVVFAVLALVPFVIRASNPSNRVMPPAGATLVLITGAAMGIVLTKDSLRTHLGLLAPLAHAANIVTFGVSKGVASRQRIASGRERREVLEHLRTDEGVAAVTLRIAARTRLRWRHARVSSPTDAGSSTGTYLVSVPGDGVNLRIVVRRGRSWMVIGESTDEVVTYSSDRLSVGNKTPTPAPCVA